MIGRKDFGLAVRAYRYRNGISQESLGRKIGMSKNSISRIELGDPRVNPRTMTLLIKHLNLTDSEVAELAMSATGPASIGYGPGPDITADRNGFGAAIRDYRHQKNLSQAELGKKIGVSESTISRLEYDEKPYRPSTKARVVRYFNLFHPELVDLARSLEVDVHSEAPKVNRAAVGRTCDNGSSMTPTTPEAPATGSGPERPAIEACESTDFHTDKWQAVCRLLARFEDRRVDARTIEQLGELLPFAIWKRYDASDKP